MARLNINTAQIKANINFLNNYLASRNKIWTLVVKVTAGHRELLQNLLDYPVVKNSVHSLGGSHIDNLAVIKSIDPTATTMYIKPPALDEIEKVVEFADISLNSSYRTISALQKEAQRQGKIHKVIIMIEMGELREGIMRETVLNFYRRVFRFPNIKVIGLGTNLGCLFGVEPTYDKLIQLSLYEQLIEAKFEQKLEMISGGSSITLPLVKKGKLPKNINHFRIGEAAFLGTSPLDNKRFLSLNRNNFNLEANILELYKKDSHPDGIIGEAGVGHTTIGKGKSGPSYRAIVDVGLLDIPHEYLQPEDASVQFIGNSSDMTVFDLGNNRNGYKVGEAIKFKLNYLGVANLMCSDYVQKVLL